MRAGGPPALFIPAFTATLRVALLETAMFDMLANIGKSGFYWLALAVIGLLSEAVGLFYQYGLDEMPCVLCIHVRLWIMALV
ncbi:MAG: disulfide bond formation protein B, partial [Gammaproteobacteria bacterium]|nr:disulfide bond formation protein B [Gammaproteobacteria bacterium]